MANRTTDTTTIDRAFELRSEGYALGDIVKIFEKEKIKTPTGRSYNAPNLSRLLKANSRSAKRKKTASAEFAEVKKRGRKPKVSKSSSAEGLGLTGSTNKAEALLAGHPWLSDVIENKKMAASDCIHLILSLVGA